MNNKKGFTLLELLLVISIMSAIVVVAIPIYKGVTEDIIESSIKKELESVLDNASNRARTALQKVRVKMYNYNMDIVLMKYENEEWIEEKYIDRIQLGNNYTFSQLGVIEYNKRGFSETEKTFILKSNKYNNDIEIKVYTDGSFLIKVLK